MVAEEEAEQEVLSLYRVEMLVEGQAVQTFNLVLKMLLHMEEEEEEEDRLIAPVDLVVLELRLFGL